MCTHAFHVYMHTTSASSSRVLHTHAHSLTQKTKDTNNHNPPIDPSNVLVRPVGTTRNVTRPFSRFAPFFKGTDSREVELLHFFTRRRKRAPPAAPRSRDARDGCHPLLDVAKKARGNADARKAHCDRTWRFISCNV